jgi:hypothetical protein
VKKLKIKKPNYKPELVQIQSMKMHQPNFTFIYSKDGILIFKGQIQPSSIMPIYTITIEFRGDNMPRVRVLSPTLVEKPPHYYHSLNCLCLYKPADFHWIGTKPICNYIIPWAKCWLYFYEVWKETGKWFGPEAEHDTNSEKHE